MNALSDRVRDDYLLAGALVGRDFHAPSGMLRMPTAAAHVQR